MRTIGMGCSVPIGRALVNFPSSTRTLQRMQSTHELPSGHVAESGDMSEPAGSAAGSTRDFFVWPRLELPRLRFVAAIVPMHAESELAHTTIASISQQSRVPDFVVYVCDNCPDETSLVVRTTAASYDIPFTIIHTVNNEHKKAGGMNVALETCIVPWTETFGLDPDDVFVLQMDGDSLLHRDFIEHGLTEFEADPSIGGLCSNFEGRYELLRSKTDGRSLRAKYLMWCQATEFVQYHFTRIVRTVPVLSGTSTMFRLSALQQVRATSDDGHAWPSHTLVEDKTLTDNLLRLGWDCRAGVHMKAFTDLLPAFRPLWRQRIRWAVGTTDGIKAAFGPLADFLRHPGQWRHFRDRKSTFPHRFEWLDLGRQILTVLGICYYPVWMTALVRTRDFASVQLISFYALFLVLRALPLRKKMGWRSFFFAGLVLPIQLFNLMRIAWTVSSYVTKKRAW